MAGVTSWSFVAVLLAGVTVTLAGYHSGSSEASNVHHHHNYYGDVHNHQGPPSHHHDDHDDSHDDDHDDDDDDDDEEDHHVYRFRVDNDFPGYSYTNDRGEVVGFNPELVYKVCGQAGKRCHWTYDIFNNCWAAEGGGRPGWGLLDNWYDGCVGVIPTPERKNAFNFTEPFTDPIQWQLYFKEEHEGNLDGVKVGFVDGYSLNPHCFGKHFEGAFEPVTVKTYANLVEAIEAGTVDAIPGEHNDKWAQEHRLIAHGDAFACYNNGLGVMIPYGSDVITWWNEAFEALVHSGEFGRFCHRQQLDHSHSGDIKCIH